MNAGAPAGAGTGRCAKGLTSLRKTHSPNGLRMRPDPLALITSLALAVFSQPAAAEFPASFDHAFGSTIIPAPPERIVTLGWITQDVVLALGRVPVALPLQPWGGDANGVMPWVAAAIAALGAELPPRFDDANIPFETLLMLRPDAILAPYSGLREQDHARLATIAPTLAWSGAPWTGRWEDITLTVGRALGQEAEAADLVARTRAHLDAAAAAHPEFQGRSFTFGWGNPAAGTFGVYLPADPRVQLLEGLGLRLSDGVRGLGGAGFFREISLEDLARVEADLLILWQSDQAELDALLAHPVFARFPPVARGCLVPILDRSFAMAASAPSPLSIPWAVDLLAPELAARLAPGQDCGP